ncbi:MAG: outer membrane protein assembly factor BamE [Candidatus Azobacteroides sp.]|nr:outer membrane protein assembly factor BamE [Candidatus Azobacteroides sp.]
MKKFLFMLFAAATLTACGSAYNSALKQIELGMTQQEVVSLMGNNYTQVPSANAGDSTIEYVDRYKNHWYFVFDDNRLVKWYKETE